MTDLNLKETAADSFVKLLEDHDDLHLTKNLKVSPISIHFDIENSSFKIVIQMGNIAVSKDGNRIFTRDFDEINKEFVDFVMTRIYRRV